MIFIHTVVILVRYKLKCFVLVTARALKSKLKTLKEQNSQFTVAYYDESVRH